MRKKFLMFASSVILALVGGFFASASFAKASEYAHQQFMADLVGTERNYADTIAIYTVSGYSFVAYTVLGLMVLMWYMVSWPKEV